MKYSLIAIALAAMLAGCSSSATRDRLQIQDPTVLQTGFSATQSEAAGAVTSQWIAAYGGVKNATLLSTVQTRLNALGERKNNYFGAKAQCWLNAARDERSGHDGWGFVEEALVQADHLTAALENRSGSSRRQSDIAYQRDNSARSVETGDGSEDLAAVRPVSGGPASGRMLRGRVDSRRPRSVDA